MSSTRMSKLPESGPPIAAQRLFHGLLAEFHTEEEVLAAALEAHGAGYRNMDAYTPFPVDGLAEALGFRSRYRMNYVILGVLLLGAALGFGLQYVGSVLDYPLNTGGRPLNSWPAYLPVIFETMILFGAVATFVSMLLFNGLPASNRALRNTPRFNLASRDRFFLFIETDDEQFDPEATRQFLQELGAVDVVEVRE